MPFNRVVHRVVHRVVRLESAERFQKLVKHGTAVTPETFAEWAAKVQAPFFEATFGSQLVASTKITGTAHARHHPHYTAQCSVMR